ncbi:DUF2304 domain-containing protein, partial [Corynebacterium bovis]|uniref:DUF2304 domain-containing protein n=3 Tax=Corynebacterium bovis TaxID=36808 RepID=UPI000FC15D35
MTGTHVIQVLLLLAMAALGLFFLSNRRKARAKAGVKIGFVVFVVASLWAVLRPDDLTVIAQWLGVTRGTDLLLYVLVIAFLFTTLSTYIRFREQELRYARLARAVALTNAVPPADDAPADDAPHGTPAMWQGL